MSALRIKSSTSHAQVGESFSLVPSPHPQISSLSLTSSSFRHLGPYWTSAHLLSRPNLLELILVLRYRHHRPNNLLLRRSPLSRFAPQIPHGALNLRRSSSNPSRNPPQLPILGSCRIHLPETYQTEIFRLVVTIELFDEQWIGPGTGIEHAVYFFCIYVE